MRVPRRPRGRRGGVVEERHHRRGAAQPERPAAGHAAGRRSSCCRPTTRCSAGRAARATSAAGSRRTSATRGRSAREAGRSASGSPREGVLGRFAVDFVVDRDSATDPGRLRHRAQPAQGRHHAPVPHAAVPDRRHLRPGRRRCSPRRAGARSTWWPPTTSSRRVFRGLTHDDLFDIVARHGLHFDQARQTGVVFHMMSALSELGRVGLTAVGDTPQQADATYRRAERILIDEAEAALAGPALAAL